MDNYLDKEKTWDIKRDMQKRARLLILLGIYFFVATLLSNPQTIKLSESRFSFGYEYVLTWKFIGSKALWLILSIIEILIGVLAFLMNRRILFIAIAIWSTIHGIWALVLMLINAFNVSPFISSMGVQIAIAALYLGNAYKSLDHFHEYEFLT